MCPPQPLKRHGAWPRGQDLTIKENVSFSLDQALTHSLDLREPVSGRFEQYVSTDFARRCVNHSLNSRRPLLCKHLQRRPNVSSPRKHERLTAPSAREEPARTATRHRIEIVEGRIHDSLRAIAIPVLPRIVLDKPQRTGAMGIRSGTTQPTHVPFLGLVDEAWMGIEVPAFQAGGSGSRAARPEDDLLHSFSSGKPRPPIGKGRW